MILIFILVLLIILMLTGRPVLMALCLTASAFFVITLMKSVPIEPVMLKLLVSIEKYQIIAVPFFILAGGFLAYSGGAKCLSSFLSSFIGTWFGRVVLLVSLIVCALLVEILSFISPAIAIATILVLLPTLLMVGFPKYFHIEKDNIYSDLLPQPKTSNAPWLKVYRELVGWLLLFLMVMVGLSMGIFTPTEAGFISAIYAFITTVFIYKSIQFKQVLQVTLNTLRISIILLGISISMVLYLFIYYSL
jgi:C4-dicarboxylate transporter DctM subunit